MDLLGADGDEGLGRVSWELERRHGELEAAVEADTGCEAVARHHGTAEQIGLADEVGGEGRARAVVDLGGGAELLDAAAIDDGDAVAHRERLLLVVGDEDEGDAQAALEVLELELHRVAKLGVESGEWFVEEEHLGPADNGAGKRDALALAAGKLVGPARGHLAQGYHPKRVADARVGLGRRDPLHAEAEADILAHREMREQGVALEHLVHIAPVRRLAGDVGAVEEDGADVGILEAGQQAQERRLAAAGGTEERQELAGAHGEADVVDGGEIPEALGDAADLDHGGPVGTHAWTRAPRRCSRR